ncbi:L,D-transpeptidase [Vibrio azureus]|uniref:Putative L,D-transpeptidase n=1 Tax=Vibrio azureus NBRC 104587 TaxID=1219077 RepID=U3C1H4_9VIBR|nr:L,D-transpeptidase [Vibrio azureus]GAD75324.1 putative L,D-transpeptidase [Vibrio azureus NBRC 104587]
MNAQILIITALMVPFCSFSAVVSSLDGASTEVSSATDSYKSSSFTGSSSTDSSFTDGSLTESASSDRSSLVEASDDSFKAEAKGAVASLAVEKRIHFPSLVDELYQNTNYQLHWVNEKSVEALMSQMQQVAFAGVTSEFAHQRQRIEQVRRRGDSSDIDLVMTDSLLMYLSYLEQLPEHGKEWLFSNKVEAFLPPVGQDMFNRLSNALNNGELNQFLASLKSPLQQEPVFQTTVSDLIEQSQQDIPLYTQKGLLKVGDELLERDKLIQRLAIVGIDVTEPSKGVEASGHPGTDQVTEIEELSLDVQELHTDASDTNPDASDTNASDNQASTYDEVLQSAVKDFQKMHGLKTDGVIGPKTLSWLNASPQQRLHSLALNSERSRIWSKDRNNTVFVNIPSYGVTYWHDGSPVFQSKVIVGRESRKTPIMTGTINSVILNPTWNVPRKIMVKDIIPKVQNNPMYLIKQNIQVIRSWESSAAIDPSTINWATVNPNTFPYRMRQSSGNHNALGLYKFNMPNPQAIYLHDTPSKGLFNTDRRAYSSGCVRVEYADKLAELLFKSQGLEARLAKKRRSGRRANNWVQLNELVQVHIIYQTVLIEDGELSYRDDIYHYDKNDTASVSL